MGCSTVRTTRPVRKREGGHARQRAHRGHDRVVPPACTPLERDLDLAAAERVDELLRRAERDHLAVIDDADAIAEALCLVHVSAS